MADEFILQGSLLNSHFIKQMEKNPIDYLTEVLLSYGNKILMVDEMTGDNLRADRLLKDSSKLAGYLQFLGYAKGNVIGIISENRVEYAVITLATLRIGAILTTFNTQYTANELEHVFQLSEPSLIFASSAHLNKAIALLDKFKFAKDLILIDEKVKYGSLPFASLSTILSEAAIRTAFTPVKSDPNDGAMILYSSGTTGLPKGVTLTNRGIVYVLQIHREKRIPCPTENSYVIGLLPMFHGYGVLVNLNCLVCGFTLIIMKQFEERAFLSRIEKYKVKHFYLVPTLVVLLSKSRLVNEYDLSSIEEIYCGAAPLSINTITSVTDKLKLNYIYECYGMTEVSFICTAPPRNKVKAGSVGKVLPGLKCKIVDLETGRSLAAKKRGELCFKGPTMMKGYYNDREQTRNIIDSNMWLHTGDVGYYDEDEYIFIVDRVKELIKYKGYQIAPTELESLLLKHKCVRDVGVVGIPDEIAGELPKAFVVKEPFSDITEDDIIHYVADRVSPPKKLRGGVAFVNEIPRNASGKILRRELKTWIKSKI